MKSFSIFNNFKLFSFIFELPNNKVEPNFPSLAIDDSVIPLLHAFVFNKVFLFIRISFLAFV